MLERFSKTAVGSPREEWYTAAKKKKKKHDTVVVGHLIFRLEAEFYAGCVGSPRVFAKMACGCIDALFSTT